MTESMAEMFERQRKEREERYYAMKAKVARGETLTWDDFLPPKYQRPKATDVLFVEEKS